MFFVVPRNGQALLGMPDTAALKLISINIDFIQAEAAECKTNIGDAWESNITQETHTVEKSCTNTDADSKMKHSINGHSDNNNVNTITNYFPSSPNVELDKRKSSELMHKIHNVFGDV